MNKVVYFLGAGFSAPLGLPLMSNFLIKSKDMYSLYPTRFEHFKSVFDVIKEMSVSKNYFETDLFNIEEILSILEMRQQIDGPTTRDTFVKYLIDVIEYYTPPVKPRSEGGLPGNWHRFVFPSPTQQSYGYFIASLFGLSLQLGEFLDLSKSQPTRTSVLKAKKTNSLQTSYSVITLNYDLVLENFAKFFNDRREGEDEIKLVRDDEEEQPKLPPLSKIHGSVHSKNIVPPTWNKALHPESILAWRRAFKLLKEANHIRFIGYSLPTADSYVKYLLKAAAIEAPHLKSIDVLCLDGDGKVKNRFDEFISFYKYRFVNGSALDYLNEHHETLVKPCEQSFGTPMICDKLEDFHEKFFENRKSA
jgi:hypothetical protein